GAPSRRPARRSARAAQQARPRPRRRPRPRGRRRSPPTSRPDLPGTQDGVNAGFLAYPALADLVDTVGETPGDGQPVTAMTPNYNQQPLDMDRNPFWQGLNERLGSVLDVRMVPGADYSNVFATTVASGEMPDLFTLYASPRLPEFLQDRKSTRLNSSHVKISYAVFCLKKKNKKHVT